ncbi:MAG: hypothetical protein JWQ49_2783 [Edaphobacter sp.]|nr:hypothetical protein [Edaphobacter sp.]
MIQFTYKLKVNERVHPRYNPEKDDMVDGLREHYFRIGRKLRFLRYTWNAR